MAWVLTPKPALRIQLKIAAVLKKTHECSSCGVVPSWLRSTLEFSGIFVAVPRIVVALALPKPGKFPGALQKTLSSPQHRQCADVGSSSPPATTPGTGPECFQNTHCLSQSHPLLKFSV